MSPRSSVTLGIVALLLCVSCNGVDEPRRPEVLASKPVTFSGGIHGIGTDLFFALDVSSIAPGCTEQGVAIFYRTMIRDGDDDRTLVADASNEPDFAAFAHLLTDGVDEQVTRCAGIKGLGAGAEGSSESRFFGKPDTAPDFKGYTIDRVEFQIESASVVSPGSDLWHDGKWTDYDLAGRVVVWGHR